MKIQIILMILVLFTACDTIKNNPEFNDTEFKDYSNITTLNTSVEENVTVSYQPRLNKTISIAGHYVSSFTEAKVNNEMIFNDYKEIYGRYNIIALQNIEDIDVVSRIAGPLDKKYKISAKVGDDFKDYYYAFMYDRDLNLEKAFEYTKGNIYYNPYIGIFSVGEYRFAIVNMMTLNVDAQEEIKQIEEIVVQLRATEELNDIYIMGNLHADCEYYTDGVYLKEYQWLITDNTDVNGRNCVYSRIIDPNPSNALITSSGVDTLNYLNFEYDSLKLVISSEYPVWVELKV